jgi:hypothetical protein
MSLKKRPNQSFAHAGYELDEQGRLDRQGGEQATRRL